MPDEVGRVCGGTTARGGRQPRQILGCKAEKGIGDLSQKTGLQLWSKQLIIVELQMDHAKAIRDLTGFPSGSRCSFAEPVCVSACIGSGEQPITGLCEVGDRALKTSAEKNLSSFQHCRQRFYGDNVERPDIA